MRDDSEDRGHTIGTALAVIGAAGLVIIAARAMARKRRLAATEYGDAEIAIGEKTVFRILTIKAHPANIEKDWNDFVSDQGSDESRDASVTFAPAPGARGTEIRAELTYTPKGGKVGETVQRLRHKTPGQKLGLDLKRFKMLVETGEPVKSDASIHKHMHPARPDDSLGNANLVQEAAR